MKEYAYTISANGVYLRRGRVRCVDERVAHSVAAVNARMSGLFYTDIEVEEV